MSVRNWLVMGVAAAVTGALFLGRPDISHGAGGGVGTIDSRFAFSFASSAAGWIPSRELDGVAVDLVSQGVTNAGIGDAFCRLEVTFNDAQGAVLYVQEVSLGPGEIGRVDLPAGAPGEALSFRVTVQVVDTDKRGRVSRCFAIPSVRVYDRRAGKTEHYVPVLTS